MDDTCDQPAGSQTGSADAPRHRPQPDLPDTPAAPIDLQVIEGILADHFGIVGAALQQLPGEVDRNVKVTARDGRTLVLKISPRSVDVSRIAWQEALLRRVSEAGLKLAVPTVVPSVSGSSFATVPIDGQPSAARLLTWVPGLMLADLPEHPVPLLEDLGHVAALLTDALAHVAEPNLQHTHLWDLCSADAAVESAIDRVHDREQRRDIERIMRWFGFIKPELAALPRGVVHQDLNDFNVLASPIGQDYRISGVVDFADALHTVRVAEVAIASAYAMLRKEDPLSAMSAVVRGFNAVIPLTDDELSVLFPLAAARLCVNATVWTQRLSEHARDYAKQRMRNTWPTLARIAQIEPAYAEAVLRAECGHPASPNVDRIARWLTAARTDRRAGLSNVLPSDLRVVELDLGVDSELFDTVGGADDFEWGSADTIARERFTAGSGAMKPAWYVAPFRPSLIGTGMRGSGDHEPTTVPLGGRLIARQGTQLRLPCAGTVEEIHQPGTLTLRHEVIDCDGRELTFWSCWSGVDSDHEPGAMLQSGQPIASIAAPRDGQSNAPLGTAWITLSSTRLGLVEPAPDHVQPSRAAVWASLNPDPSQFLGLPVCSPPAEQRRPHCHAPAGTALRTISTHLLSTTHALGARSRHLALRRARVCLPGLGEQRDPCRARRTSGQRRSDPAAEQAQHQQPFPIRRNCHVRRPVDRNPPKAPRGRLPGLYRQRGERPGHPNGAPGLRPKRRDRHRWRIPRKHHSGHGHQSSPIQGCRWRRCTAYHP